MKPSNKQKKRRSEKKGRKQARILKPGIKEVAKQALSHFQEWYSLPKLIKEKERQAQTIDRTIQDYLVIYRLPSTLYEYIAINIDRDLWSSYEQIRKEMRDLASIETEYDIRFSSLTALRSMNARWDALLVLENDFFEKIEKAPAALEFYNKMSRLKAKQARDKIEDIEINQRLEKAHKSLQNALDYIEDYHQEHSIDAFGASILKYDQAREYWKKKREEIQKLEKTKSKPDLIITGIEALAKIIYDSPALAKWVNDIEKRFRRLCVDHTLLVNSYGKILVQKEYLDELSNVLTDAIPKLWASGQKDQLSQHLSEFENFLSVYEPELEREIAFQERHLRKESTVIESNIQINHLIDYTKVFMSAMDIRDPTMSSHSLTVARLAISTAKVMNWNLEDIQLLEVAALLHDIGKIWIPESILTKKGKLTKEEMKLVHMHPVYGAVLAKI